MDQGVAEMPESAAAPEGSFQLGPFYVDETGRLQPIEAGATPSFTVRWRGRRVSARMAGPPDADGDGSLSLEVILGRVPSTAGADAAANARSRSEVFEMLRRLPPVLPASWRLSLLPDHCIGLSFRDRLGLPTTATQLVSALTVFLLDLDPYLEMLDVIGSGLEAV